MLNYKTRKMQKYNNNKNTKKQFYKFKSDVAYVVGADKLFWEATTEKH